MRIFFANLLALSVLAAASPPAQAASGGDCATLSSNAEAIVVGARSGQKHLLIHDGGAYYRVEFFREPYDFPSSVPQQIRLTSNKRPRTLCATARTTVKSGDGRIHFARRVDPIRPDEIRALRAHGAAAMNRRRPPAASPHAAPRGASGIR